MEEISLREIIETVLKGKWLIAGILILCLLITSLATFFVLPNNVNAKVIMTLDFPGIEKGENPDQTKFDRTLVKTPYVIKMALESIGYDNKNVTPEEIANNITVTGVIPDDVLTKAENLLKQGKDYTYYPSRYMVTYEINNAFSYDEGAKLLDAIVDEYSKYYNEKYSDKAILSNAVGTLDYETYDYPDISEVMNNQIETIQNYLEEKVKESNNYRSKETGLTFNDIDKSLELLKEIEVKNMESIINATNLTRDKQRLITQYEYKIKLMELERNKKLSESKEAMELMDAFKKENNLLILGTDQENGLTSEANNSYYDELAKRSIEAGVEATDYEHEIEFYKSEVDKLMNDEVQQETKAQAEQDVQKMIPDIKEKMVKLIDMTNNTAEDYYEVKYGKGIKAATPAVIQSNRKILLNLAIAIVLGLMIGVFVTFFREYWKNSHVEKAA